ncbi:hypothetical protein A1O1_08300 [Capronia coronata CBS 617.96]|uniref:BRCT domain-containing protein n=1 Tax=Capronia coronata CBS 617.96 TaxID=1182541 RepID=W9XIV8_9EURO|nr:uncharacterized protein A1O1_08300 [Capronia coronata CBS 617.96]EXJ80158.1 hypothetical protein A1O1_08300 [Capronia coronata CBS 617.96]
MPPYRPNLPPPPEPTRTYFDPFNSSSTGHQRAENRLSGSTSWRDSRSYKLTHQFRDSSGRGGDRHLSDLVGAGSEKFGKDGRKENGGWEVGAPGLREKRWQDIRSLMAGNRKRSFRSLEEESDVQAKRPKSSAGPGSVTEIRDIGQLKESVATAGTSQETKDTTSSTARYPQIFRDLNIYLNGSTAPIISDHKLKHLFAQHGGGSSISLGRRTVTHVIVGNNCGGGLASGKIQKEVTLVGGKGIKYVTVHWILDSIEKGIRQPEARYAPANLQDRIGGSGQTSVRGMFHSKKS